MSSTGSLSTNSGARLVGAFQNSTSGISESQLTASNDTNLSQLDRCFLDLGTMTLAKEQAETAQDAMAIDLLQARDDLAAKDWQIAELSKELSSWQQKASMTKTKVDYRIPRDTSMSADAAYAAELSEAKQQILQLQAALHTSELEAKAEAEAKAAVTADLAVSQRSASLSVGRRPQEVEHAFRHPSQPGHPKDLDDHKEHIEELNLQLHEQHMCAEQFRKISERLTTRLKQSEASLRDLGHNGPGLRRKVKELESQLDAMRFRNQPAPAGA